MNLEAEAEAYAASETAEQVNDVVRYWAFGEESGEQVRQSAPAPQRPGLVRSVLGAALNLL